MPWDRVWVCRSCCCGPKKKHPGINRKELERAARSGAAEAAVSFDVTDYLGPLTCRPSWTVT